MDINSSKVKEIQAIVKMATEMGFRIGNKNDVTPQAIANAIENSPYAGKRPLNMNSSDILMYADDSVKGMKGTVLSIDAFSPEMATLHMALNSGSDKIDLDRIAELADGYEVSKNGYTFINLSEMAGVDIDGISFTNTDDVVEKLENALSQVQAANFDLKPLPVDDLTLQSIPAFKQENINTTGMSTRGMLDEMKEKLGDGIKNFDISPEMKSSIFPEVSPGIDNRYTGQRPSPKM